MILAIDPGSTDSAYVLIDPTDCRVHERGKVGNDEMRRIVINRAPTGHRVAIEMIASYGMAVGAEVFETCVWIGRFVECAPGAELVYRRDVKLHHCGTARAKDPNVTQALIDRFAPGVANKGKGTKAAPGWFFGFAADVWQAMALAVLVADREMGRL